jgi:hypothetical protein
MGGGESAIAWARLRRAWAALIAHAREVTAESRNHRHVAVLRRAIQLRQRPERRSPEI